MKLVEMKCKNCGANLKVDSEAKNTYCQFCGAEFKIDDEIHRVQYDNMEQSGYEFEKGRIRAQQENQYNNQAYYSNVKQINQYYEPTYYQKKRNNKTLWIVLAWIFLFPFTATYFIAKSEKLDNKKKIIIIIVMWILFLILAISSSETQKIEKKNRIIECYSEETYNILDKHVGINNIKGNFSNTYTCSQLDLKNSDYKKIDIQMDDNNLVSIKIDNKYIYNIGLDESNNDNDSKTDRKVYNTSSGEYRDYINDLVKNIKNDYFILYSIKWVSPYIKVDFYETDSLDDETFDREKEKIINEIREEMKQNKYKSGGMFSTDYEYVSVGFFKLDTNYSDKYYQMKTFEQIDVYDF